MKKEYFKAIILFLVLTAVLSCEKEEKILLASIDTASVDEITSTSARVGGRITGNGGAEITERGVYWGTAKSPEKTGTKISSGSGGGTFYETLNSLTSGVKYYVTAYAVNSKGTSYGEETFFTTQISLPTVSTSPVTGLTSTTATAGGEVTSNGGFEITKSGIYWGTEPDPRLTGARLEIGDDDEDGVFSTTLTGLSRAYTYYVIAFATNIKGTAWGNEISFSTEPELATVLTSSVYKITTHSAIMGGVVSSSGGSDITDRGIYWGTTADPVTTGTKLMLGTGTGNFADTLDILHPGTTYYVRAYAINSLGTSLGEEKSFVTPGEEPAVSIIDFTGLTSSGITLKGIVNPGDLSTTVTFEYGTTSSYGSLVTATESPLMEKDTVTGTITGLVYNTLYHYRLKAVNEMGTVYSADSTFTTVITGRAGSVQDSEGNTYQTIGIGYQEWMTENLKSILYRNGIDSIPLVKADTLWPVITTPAYCWYGNDSTNNYNKYGALYNFYAVQTGLLCPVGWHVPTNNDITELVDYLGGAGQAGGKLKETGTAWWNSPNSGATNWSGFKARGGGKRAPDATFDFVKVEGNWWTSTSYSTLNGSYFNLMFNYTNSFQAYINKKNGLSVRCIKD